ncbi:MAG: hypothetical protein ABWX74_13960, partial [Aeromicrobium sp.]
QLTDAPEDGLFLSHGPSLSVSVGGLGLMPSTSILLHADGRDNRWSTEHPHAHRDEPHHREEQVGRREHRHLDDGVAVAAGGAHQGRWTFNAS